MKTFRTEILLMGACGLLGMLVWSTATSRPRLPEATATVAAEEAAPDVVENASKQTQPQTDKELVSQPSSPVAAPDPDSVEGILAGLGSADAEVRCAAIEWVKQLEDRSAAPRLEAIAEQLENAGEKAALLAAIEFIKLPSVTEVMPVQNTRPLKDGIPASTRALTNRYTGKPFRAPPAAG
jgi:hypothetical protein